MFISYTQIIQHIGKDNYIYIYMSLLKLNDTSYDKIDNYYKDELNDINEAQKNILDYINHINAILDVQII